MVKLALALLAAWQALHPAPLKRTEVSVARIKTQIYVAGGYESAGRSTDKLERYSITTNRWTRGKPLPIPLNHAAAATYKGDLYILGGYTDNDTSDKLLRYHRNRWSELAPMPTARGALTAGVIANRLYAAGGALNGTALNTLEIYDFTTNRWTTGPPMPTAREHLGGAVSNHAFYVLAGRSQGVNMTVVERFVANHWERVPGLTKARGGTAAATLRDGRIVIAGGEEARGTIKEVELYDPRTRTWHRLPSMRTPRHGLGVVAYKDRVFTVEGGPRPGFAFSNALEALKVR